METNTKAGDSAVSAVKMDPVGATLRNAWRRYKERWETLAAIAVVPALFLGVELFSTLSGSPAIQALGGIFLIAYYVALFWASIALVLSIANDADFRTSYAEARRYFWPMIWVAILSMAVTIGGFVMLIVPGIMMGIWFTFSSFTLILENRRGLEVLTQSREYTRGYWWAIAGRSIVFVLCLIPIFIIAGILSIPLRLVLVPAALGFLWAAFAAVVFTPLGIAFSYTMYQNLKSLKPDLAANPSLKNKTFFLWSGIIGVIAPIVIAALIIGLGLALFFKKGQCFTADGRTLCFPEQGGAPIEAPTNTAPPELPSLPQLPNLQ